MAGEPDAEIGRKGAFFKGLSTGASMTGSLALFVAKMKSAGLNPAVIETFSRYYRRIVDGESGLLSNRDILPLKPQDVIDADAVLSFVDRGKAAASETVCIVLNGGLGTSMGLTKAKSFLPVKDELTFLDIKVKQAQKSGAHLAFMNSFATHDDTVNAVENMALSFTPAYFLQNKFPKILKSDLTPAHWPKDPEMEWNPPGHGDIYGALATSGLLKKLLQRKIRYAFIANSDNLGAVLDFSLLGYFSNRNIPFMMEVAERTPADLKGGHLARLKNGRFVLREIAQCPKAEIASFQNIRFYRYFNTNNIWINLNALNDILAKDNVLDLPVILNPKHLDPRDKTSPEVIQVETAMGSAISLFQNASVIKVHEDRFHPVKKCNDLLSIRSDCYHLSKENRLVLSSKRDHPPVIKLDPLYFGQIDDFEKRFPCGVPSLIDCEALTVRGDIFFNKDIVIKGNITLTNTKNRPYTLESGLVIDRSMTI